MGQTGSLDRWGAGGGWGDLEPTDVATFVFVSGSGQIFEMSFPFCWFEPLGVPDGERFTVSKRVW